MTNNSMIEPDSMKILNTWVEIVSTKELKPEVIEEHPELKNFNGLVLKKMHKSNLTISYEKMEGGLAGFLDRKVKGCPNLLEFVRLGREKFC